MTSHTNQDQVVSGAGWQPGATVRGRVCGGLFLNATLFPARYRSPRQNLELSRLREHLLSGGEGSLLLPALYESNEPATIQPAKSL